MTYISKLQINSGELIPIGSSLYGTCNTDADWGAKKVVLAAFDTAIPGTTIHIKFNKGNSVSTPTLKIGASNSDSNSDIGPYQILIPSGNYNWAPNAVISLTLDGTSEVNFRWIVNDSDSGHETIIQNTYNANSQDAISGQGVAAALNTLGDAAEKDVIASIIETNKNSTDLPTTSAVTAYVDSKTAGLTGAMHFKGATTTAMSDGLTTPTVIVGGANYTPEPGDVVLSGEHQEYVWTETNTTTHAGHWELLGDEGSYILTTSVHNKQVVDGIAFTQGSLPTITLDENATSVLTGVSNESGNDAARAANAVVEQGILKITTGILQQFSSGTVHGVSSVTAGTLPTLTPSTADVLQSVTI